MSSTISRPRVAATSLAALAILAASLGGCAPEASPDPGSAVPAPPTPVLPSPALPASAAETAYVGRCAGCHGPSGEGGSLGPQIQSPVLDYATYVVRTGRAEMGFPGAMPAFSAATLPDAELRAILAWLGQAAKPLDGKGLFTRFCANCHGVAGEGGRVDESIVEKAFEEVDELYEAVREGHGGDAFWKRRKYMPAWGETEVSDADIARIAEYLRAQHPGGTSGDEESHEGHDD